MRSRGSEGCCDDGGGQERGHGTWGHPGAWGHGDTGTPRCLGTRGHPGAGAAGVQQGCSLGPSNTCAPEPFIGGTTNTKTGDRGRRGTRCPQGHSVPAGARAAPSPGAVCKARGGAGVPDNVPAWRGGTAPASPTTVPVPGAAHSLPRDPAACCGALPGCLWMPHQALSSPTRGWARPPRWGHQKEVSCTEQMGTQELRM